MSPFPLFDTLCMANIADFVPKDDTVKDTARRIKNTVLEKMKEKKKESAYDDFAGDMNKLEKTLKKAEKNPLEALCDVRMENAQRSASAGPGWGPSYALFCVALSFAVLNQILIVACQLMSGGGGFKELMQRSVALFSSFMALVKTPTRIIRFIIVIFTGILTFVMFIGTASDRYITLCSDGDCSRGTRSNVTIPGTSCPVGKATFKEMPALSITILIVTIIIWLLQAVSFILAFLHFTKEKFEKLLLPLLGLSVATTGMTVTSLILVCIQFTSKKMFGTDKYGDKEFEYPTSLRTSFNCLITAIVFGVFNAALNVGNMILTKKGGAPMLTRGTTTTAPSSGLPSQPSSGGNPPPPQPST